MEVIVDAVHIFYLILCVCFTGSGESVIKDPAIKSRELFTSDASDTVPITALR